jgi:RNA polymerase sigma-70 factor (ECF subfamily)
MTRSAIIGTDEDELIARAARGDRQAFGRLYELHALRVYRHACFLTGDPVLAEDIAAQVFLKALEAIPRFERRGTPFIAWLLRITCNLVINHKKSLKNSSHAQLPEALESDAGTPEDSTALKVDGERIWRHVRRLPSDQRNVIIMRFVDDLGYPEIAGLLGKSVGAVRVIQFRALANLRAMMAEELAPAAWFLQGTAGREEAATAAR